MPPLYPRICATGGYPIRLTQSAMLVAVLSPAEVWLLFAGKEFQGWQGDQCRADQHVLG